uniref:Uncharacterized protein n=1 Tax=Oryza brachyantha TaxID=4533 RepID=J3MZ37_ORYBR
MGRGAAATVAGMGGAGPVDTQLLARGDGGALVLMAPAVRSSEVSMEPSPAGSSVRLPWRLKLGACGAVPR